MKGALDLQRKSANGEHASPTRPDHLIMASCPDASEVVQDIDSHGSAVWIASSSLCSLTCLSLPAHRTGFAHLCAWFTENLINESRHALDQHAVYHDESVPWSYNATAKGCDGRASLMSLKIF